MEKPILHFKAITIKIEYASVFSVVYNGIQKFIVITTIKDVIIIKF